MRNDGVFTLMHYFKWGYTEGRMLFNLYAHVPTLSLLHSIGEPYRFE